MRFFKNSIIFLIVFALILCITGCNKEVKNLKDNILKGFNNVIESFSQHALTKDSDLQGKRITDKDSYTGTYKASYNHYNGKEYLFGGTSLQRDDGNNLKITYSLNISSGSGTLYLSLIHIFFLNRFTFTVKVFSSIKLSVSHKRSISFSRLTILLLFSINVSNIPVSYTHLHLIFIMQ